MGFSVYVESFEVMLPHNAEMNNSLYQYTFVFLSVYSQLNGGFFSSVTG